MPVAPVGERGASGGRLSIVFVIRPLPGRSTAPALVDRTSPSTEFRRRVEGQPERPSRE